MKKAKNADAVEKVEKDPKNRKSKAVRVSNIDFVKACEAMKANQELLLEKRPGLKMTVALIKEFCGVNVSVNTIAQLKTASGVNWKSGHVVPGKSISNHAVRTCASAIKKLYVAFSVSAPNDLLELCRYYDGDVSAGDIAGLDDAEDE